MGRPVQALTGSPLSFSFSGLVFASTLYSLPFVVQPLQSNFESLGRAPIETATSLGASKLDAFLALTSSGPAYVAVIAEALADGAVAAGLPRNLANYLAHRTLAGTASLLNEKELHPGELKDMVASPGGTTITALRHLEKAGLRSALMEAVVLAAERSRELA